MKKKKIVDVVKKKIVVKKVVKKKTSDRNKGFKVIGTRWGIKAEVDHLNDCAAKYCDNNMSEYIRFAVANYKPTKKDLAQLKKNKYSAVSK